METSENVNVVPQSFHDFGGNGGGRSAGEQAARQQQRGDRTREGFDVSNFVDTAAAAAAGDRLSAPADGGAAEFTSLVVNFAAPPSNPISRSKTTAGDDEKQQTAALLFEMPWHKLWYSSSVAEEDFIVFQRKGTRFRYAALCVLAIAIVIPISLNTQNAEQLGYIAAMGGIFTVGAVMEIVLWLVERAWDRRHSSSLSTSSSADIGATPTRNARHSAIGAVLSSVHHASNATTTAAAAMELKRRILMVRLARAHEAVGSVVWLTMIPTGAAAYEFVQEKCFYLYTEDEREHDEKCPTRFYTLYYCFILAPIFVGGCRSFILGVAYLIGYALSLAIVRFHDTSTVGTVLIFVINGLSNIFAFAVLRINEMQRRRNLETRTELTERATEITMHNKAVQNLVQAIIPAGLRGRLLSPAAASRIHVDISERAVCVVVDIFNVVAAMNSMLPTVAATAIGLLNIRMLFVARHYNVSHVRTVGDANFFVNNLFKDDGADDDEEQNNNGAASTGTSNAHAEITEQPSTESTSVAKDNENDDESEDPSIPCARSVQFCLSALKLQGDDAPFALRCSAAMGSLIGMPMGAACITYDIFGPAFGTAQQLLLSCPSSRCLVEDQVVVHSSEYFHFERSGIANGWFFVIDEKDSAEDAATTTGGGDDNTINTPSPPVPPVRSPLPLAIASGGGDADAQHYQDADQEAPQSTTATAGFGKLQTAKHLTNKAIILREETNLASTSRCCCGGDGFIMLKKFDDPSVEDSFAAHQRKEHHRSFLVSCAFLTVLSLLILVVVGEDQAGRNHDAAMIAFFIITAISCAGFGLLAGAGYIDASDAEDDDDPPLPEFPMASRVASTLCLLMIVGVNLSRPSIVGDDTSPVMLICLVICELFGGPIVEVLSFQFGFMITNVIIFFLYNPAVTQISPGVTLLCLIAMVHTILSERLQRSLFEDMVKAREALLEAKGYSDLREAVRNGMIPPQIRSRITAEALKKDVVDCWGCDYAVVLHLVLPPMDYATMAPKKIRKHAESTTGRIEMAVLRCKNRALDIVKVFGGTVIVAGPLEQHKSSPGAIVHAIADAMEVVEALLVSGLQFTAGITSEQVISVLRLNEFPSYEIMGLAVHAAKALAMAVPAPMVVATSKVVDMYRRECDGRPDLVIDEPETWRLRGLGSQQVSRIRCTQLAMLRRHVSKSHSNQDTRSVFSSEVSVGGVSLSSVDHRFCSKSNSFVRTAGSTALPQ